MAAFELQLAWRRTRQSLIALFIFLFLYSQFFLFATFGSKDANFFFEKATSQSVVEGYAKAGILRREIANLELVLVSDYVKWHSNKVSGIKRGNESLSKVQTMIFFGNGRHHGLGDRFRGIMFAYLLCVFTERVLLIQWDEPYPLSRIFVNGIGTNFTYDPMYFTPSQLSNGSEDAIHVGDVKSMHDLPKVLSSAQTVWFECEPRVNWREVFEVLEEFPALPISRKLSKFLPFEVRPQATSVLPLILRALFRPSPEFKKLMSARMLYEHRFSLSRIWARSPLRKIRVTHPYVSVHARLGHGVGEHTKRFDLESVRLTLESLADCMANQALELARKVELADPPRFYLATDTVEFRGLFEKAVARLDKRVTVMYGLWNVRHVKDIHQRRAGDLSMYMYTMLDVYLLSKGKAAVCGRSGFCTLATWMGGIGSTSYFKRDSCVAFNGSKGII